MFEDEAYRRVVEGVPRPIYKQGVQIGERRVKSEGLLKFLLVANVPDKYGKRDLPPLRPEEEPGRKEFTEKHNAMVREEAELNRAFEDWVLCHSANRNHRVPPCTQGRECSIYGCGGKGLLCSKGTEGSEQYKIKIKEHGIECGKATPYGEDAETGRPGDAERAGYSDQLSVNSNQSAPSGTSNQTSARSDQLSVNSNQWSVSVSARESEPASAHQGSYRVLR